MSRTLKEAFCDIRNWCSRQPGYNTPTWSDCERQLDDALKARPDEQVLPNSDRNGILRQIEAFVFNSHGSGYSSTSWNMAQSQVARALAGRIADPEPHLLDD